MIGRPTTIAQMVCVTTKVTKASLSQLHLVEATRVRQVWFYLKMKASKHPIPRHNGHSLAAT
jgi:hypothetical protein